MLTKAAARGLIQQWIDDPSGARWQPTNLDLVIEQTLDDLWTDVLEAAPMLTSKLDTLTPAAPGFVDGRAVANGGQLSQRLFRIQSIVRDGQTYRETDTRDIVLEVNAALVQDSFSYARYGDQFWLFPLALTSVEFRYSFKPQRFSTLSEGATVMFPDGHESAYVFEAASRALDKGTAEESGPLERRALRAYDRLMTGVVRNSRGATMPYIPTGESIEWGGE